MIEKTSAQDVNQDDKDEGLRSQLNQDFKQHIEVLYEKFKSDVQIIAEQVQSVDRKVDTVASGLKETNRKVELLSTKVDALTMQQEVLDKKMNLIFKTVGQTKIDVTEIKEMLET